MMSCTMHIHDDDVNTFLHTQLQLHMPTGTAKSFAASVSIQTKHMM